MKFKQHNHVIYLRCVLDVTMSAETMVLRVIEKINSRVEFLYKRNQVLDFPLRRLFCNTLIQPPLIMPMLRGPET